MIKFAAAIAFAIVATTLCGRWSADRLAKLQPDAHFERYAPLDQINRANVSKLKQLCVYDLRIDTSFQTGPIVIGRTMYATTDKEILAIDAANLPTEMAGAGGGTLHRPARQSRSGLSRWPALSAARPTGTCWPTTPRPGRSSWSTRIAYQDKGESIPSAPIAWNGLVFIGTAGSERHGVLGAYARSRRQTGKVAWETYTVPTEAPQPGNEKMQQQAKATWGNASDVPITGGGTWSSLHTGCRTRASVCARRQSGPDFANAVRPGSNLYTNSILILDAKTGIYRNHYSLVPADFHDWDLAAAPYSSPPRAASASSRGAEGRPSPRLRSGDRPEAVRDGDHDARERGRAVVDEPTRFCPEPPVAPNGTVLRYSPDTNMFYSGTVDWCVTVTLDPAELAKKPGQTWTGTELAAQFGKRDLDWAGWVDRDRCRRRTGQVALHRLRAPVLSGITPTKGGPVFAADMDKHAYAFDASNGKILWRTDLPGAPGGGLITYAVDGKQCVAFVTGTRSQVFPASPASSRIVIFGL